MPPSRSRSKRSRSDAWYPSTICPRSPRGRLAKKGIRCAEATLNGGRFRRVNLLSEYETVP
eukprot:6693228-Alexandrium_andersonii.AAC.1